MTSRADRRDGSGAIDEARLIGAVQAGAAGLGIEERELLQGRVEKAREMPGGTDVRKYFRAWKAPEER